jgi:RNA polymerase sigma-70 factor (ECF subfamily)
VRATERAGLNEWMGRIAAGDRGACEPLFRATWPVARRFAIRLCASEADGEDTAQQALMRVFERSGDYQPDRDALSWIFGIVAYECRSRARRVGRRRALLQARPEQAEPAAGPEELVMRRELTAALEAVLGELAPEDLETILAAVEERERSALPAATFRKRLQPPTPHPPIGPGATKRGRFEFCNSL